MRHQQKLSWLQKLAAAEQLVAGCTTDEFQGQGYRRFATSGP
jgi:hypothetical protein